MALTADLKRFFRDDAKAQFVSARDAENNATTPPTLAWSERACAINITRHKPYYVLEADPSFVAPFSMTKLMTIYTLLQYRTEAQCLSQTATIDSFDIGGGQLVAGDVMTLDVLIGFALVESDNTTPKTIARIIGQELLTAEGGGTGNFISVERFVEEMNTQAARLGMYDTVWLDPVGLEASIVSPMDMTRVTGALEQYGIVLDWWTDASYVVSVTHSGTPTNYTITNTNPLLGDPGYILGKTGTGGPAHVSMLWRAPNGDTIGLVSMTDGGSGTIAGRFADIETMVAQLPVDYPELAAATGVSATLAALTVSATGALRIAGAASHTLAALTVSATGALRIAGAASHTLATLTLSSQGTLGTAGTGSLSQTLAAATLAAAGTLPIAGTLSQTLAATTLGATGVAGATKVGTLSATLGAATLAATATLPIVGTLSQTLGALTTSAAGRVDIAAQLGITLGNLVLAAAAGSGAPISATLSQTLAGVTLSAAGYSGTPVYVREPQVVQLRKPSRQIGTLLKSQ
jgi:D-alanyl-D-alanine carboxypeptidase